MWIYRVQVLSKRGNHIFNYTHALTDREYGVPWIRAEAERKAEAELRAMEGVKPDMSIEHLGWNHFEETARDDG